MENATKLKNESATTEKMTLTANEVANAVGENYKSVAKILKVLATNGEIEVTEKLVNNRALTGYRMSISDIQAIKGKFIENKHLSNRENEVVSLLLENAGISVNNTENNSSVENDTNVKFYEVVNENAELKQELSAVKDSLQKVKNENVQLNADLTVERSKVKYIEDKSNTIEADNSRQRQEIQQLQEVVKHRNIALMVLGAVLLMILTAFLTVNIIVK